MRNLLGKIVAGQNARQFDEQLRAVRLYLYAELKSEYEPYFGLELGSILAAQVVNYLTGEDLDESYANADDFNQSQIRRIKDQIVPRAQQKMFYDQILRETIVYTHRMKSVLMFARDGDDYLQSQNKKRSDAFLFKYGAEFHAEVNPKLYARLVARFRQAKQPFVSARSW